MDIACTRFTVRFTMHFQCLSPETPASTPMIAYEITAVVSEPLTSEYESYMKARHIPDVLSTGCFTAASISRGDPGTYRISYLASDRTTFDRYIADYAPALRDHFNQHFPKGVTLSRKVWETIEEWPRG